MTTSASVPVDTIPAVVVASNGEINNQKPVKQRNFQGVRGLLDCMHEEDVGVVAGICMAVKTVKCVAEYRFTSSAIKAILRAQAVPLSDLASIHTSFCNRLVLVRGFVTHQRDRGVYNAYLHNSIIQGVFTKLTTYNYSSKRKLMSSCFPARNISIDAVPMVISSRRDSISSDAVDIVLDLNSADSLSSLSHSLPLDIVYKTSFLDAINPFFHGVQEKKILPIGKEISAIGYVYQSSRSSQPQIEACHDLPFFVSGLTKDQMLEQLLNKKVLLLYGGIALGSLSLCLLAISLRRYWRRWKRQQQKQLINQSGAKA